MIVASIAPASPPLAGRFDCQTAGVSSARMSSKSPSLFTLQRRELGDVEIAGPVVAMLDQQPAAAIADRLPPRRPR